MKVLKWKFKWYRGAIILYKQDAIRKKIYMTVKLIFVVRIGSYIVSDERFALNKDLTAEAIITAYKRMIDDRIAITKIK